MSIWNYSGVNFHRKGLKMKIKWAPMPSNSISSVPSISWHSLEYPAAAKINKSLRVLWANGWGAEKSCYCWPQDRCLTCKWLKHLLLKNTCKPESRKMLWRHFSRVWWCMPTVPEPWFLTKSHKIYTASLRPQIDVKATAVKSRGPWIKVFRDFFF